MKTIGDIEKWSWGELTSSPNGKTSSSATAGFITIIVGLIGFLFSLFIKSDIVFIYACITIISIGSGLLGYNKNQNTKDLINNIPEEVKETKTEIEIKN